MWGTRTGAPRRHAAALALLLLGAVACSPASEPPCPGTPVASFQFSGVPVPPGDPSLAGLDPVPSIPACDDAVGYAGSAPPVFAATLSADPGTGTAALCRPNGVVLFGARAGDRFTVETSTTGAVLKDCDASCAAGLRLFVAGDLLPGGGADPAGFQGILVEVMSQLAGSCGPCVLPCAARYALTGTLVP